MRVNRAPGSDNIRIEFYQHCWDIVKFDIVNLFTTFHNGSLNIQRINYGIITLFQKCQMLIRLLNIGQFISCGAFTNL
jgi:hypothetical protein